MTNMNVEEFKIKIQKIIIWVLVLVEDLWTWTIVAYRLVNFVNY
jgi:hypothetical protein